MCPSDCSLGSGPEVSSKPSDSTRNLTEAEVLRTGRILARLRSRIDQMLDEVEECAKVLTSEGESVNDQESAVIADLFGRRSK